MGWFPRFSSASWERFTRTDFNGDGIVGHRGSVLRNYYRNPAAYSSGGWMQTVERWTGRDMNGDGFVGNPHQVAHAHRVGGNPYAMPPGPYGPPPIGYIPGPPVAIPPYNPGFWGYVGQAVNYGVGFALAPFQIAGEVVGGVINGAVSAVKSVVKSIKKIF